MRAKAGIVRRNHALLLSLAAATVFAVLRPGAVAQEVGVQLDPQSTTVNFTLGDVLHTVRGSFRLKQGSLHLDPSSGKLAGDITVDAKSGQSGSGVRDRKMHREVLESDHYPEITFRPDRVEGPVLLAGKSSVRVHGIFTIHGSDHEMTLPAQLEMSANQWTATLHFTVPYVTWGMRNPSTLFLRVSETVDIDVTAVGTVTRP